MEIIIPPAHKINGIIGKGMYESVTIKDLSWHWDNNGRVTCWVQGHGIAKSRVVHLPGKSDVNIDITTKTE